MGLLARALEDTLLLRRVFATGPSASELRHLLERGRRRPGPAYLPSPWLFDAEFCFLGVADDPGSLHPFKPRAFFSM